MILQDLKKKGAANPPDWLPQNTIYLSIMGSAAYGTAVDSSDIDYYGICIPQRDIVFPHLAGYIEGFSSNIPHFEQWLEHHIKDPLELEIVEVQFTPTTVTGRMTELWDAARKKKLC